MTENITGDGVSKTTNQVNKSSKKLYKILIILILLLLFVAGLTYYKNTQTSSSCNGKNDNPIYINAAKVINPQASAKLKVVVDQISTSSGSNKDPNCMYIATVYYLNIGDSNNARLYFDKFNKVYDSKVGLVKVLAASQINTNRLKQSIEIIENSSKQSKSNDKLWGQKIE